MLICEYSVAMHAGIYVVTFCHHRWLLLAWNRGMIMKTSLTSLEVMYSLCMPSSTDLR